MAHCAIRLLSAMIPVQLWASPAGKVNDSPSLSGLSVDGVSVVEKTELVQPEESPESLLSLRSRKEDFCLKFSTKCSISSSILRCTNSVLFKFRRGSSNSGLDNISNSSTLSKRPPSNSNQSEFMIVLAKTHTLRGDGEPKTIAR